MSNEIEVGAVTDDKPIPMDEIRARVNGPADEPIIEKADRKNLSKLAKEEAFMNETVVIHIAPGQIEGDLPAVYVSVNGTNEIHIPRGRDTKVKRMHVEALLHAQVTTFNQTQNLVDPSDAPLRPSTGLLYPFTVLKDTPEGMKWFRQKLEAQRRGV